MKKAEILNRLMECGVIAVVRAESADQAIRIADACLAAGIIGIEITYTVPGATEIIRALTQQYGPEKMIVGAGTVLDSETARLAILAGANYIVSPCLNVATVKTALRYQIPCMAGAMTIKETVDCMEAGADIVKIFPGNLFGPKIIKAIHGPIPQALLMPTGGVNADNAGEWITAGACAVGAGSDLTAGAKTGDYAAVTAVGKKMIAAVAAARNK